MEVKECFSRFRGCGWRECGGEEEWRVELGGGEESCIDDRGVWLHCTSWLGAGEALVRIWLDWAETRDGSTVLKARVEV